MGSRVGWVALVASAWAMAFTGCSSESPGSDGGLEICASDSDCDDGRFCNGEETCAPEDGAAGADGCVAGASPCGSESCDEAADECDEDACDADGDGVTSIACGGGDCDDDDPNRYPGNVEVCDAMDVDEDCDELTFGVRDADGDGAPDARCCNGDHCGDDCDDARAIVSPLLLEVCDSLDNDCDGAIDEGVLTTFTIDADTDGYGSDASDAVTMEACAAPAGYAPNTTDCDDEDGEANPGNAEICDDEGRDEDCDGTVNEDCECTAPASRSCSEGGLLGTCATGTQTCDALTGTWGACSIAPGVEVCNGSDDDCDGEADDGVAIACYADPDGDGYAAAGASVTMRCVCTSGHTDRAPVDAASTDCRESPEAFAAASFPGATEQCDGIDNDCSSGGGAVAAEDRDDDGYTATDYTGCAGGPYPRGDCHDGNADVNPGADYQSTPFCPAGTRLCTCGTTLGRCVTPGPVGSCPACLPTGGTPPSFDYDCSGTTTAQPALASCSGSCCSPRCGPTTSQSTGNCGLSVAHACCTSSGAGCASGCVAGSAGNRALACR